METIFKVGDTVYDGVHFPDNRGEVIDIRQMCVYVKWRHGVDPVAYTGVWLRSLSKVPYDFKLPEQPVEYEKYERVLVKISGDRCWHPTLFMKWDGKHMMDVFDNFYRHVRKWDESLIGKTTE